MAGRRLSFWAWGYEDRFPGEEQRRELAGQLQGMLGFEGVAPREVPQFEAVEIPDPRLQPPPSLAEICSLDPYDRALHTYGRSYRDQVRALAGDFSPAPDVVACPTTEEQVVAALDWASRDRVAVVPFGGGTSVVGGVECRGEGYAGVVSLDLRGLSRVLEVDPISCAARIQAGATGPVLDEQLAEHGFTLRHYPQSFELSTLGGWIATRAGGHFATVYTHIDDLVESVRMQTPRGLYETRRLPASGAGPSPDRLAFGSEGIFGVITEAWVRVFPRPRHRSSASVRFTEFDAAVGAVREIAQARLFPANCRLLDPMEALINRVAGDGSTVVLLGFESHEAPRREWLEQALALCTRNGGRCPDGPRHRDAGEKVPRDDAAGAWRKAFFEAPYLHSALVSLGALADTFETACTWDRFPALHADVVGSVRETMARVCSGAGLVTCRFTHVYPDGPAPYYTFVAPGRAGAELEQWAEIKRAASDALLRNGATITHHHAVGRVHRPWYDRQRPAPFAEVLRAAKRVLDPAAVLNPGVLVDP